ncbi:MAG: hypothetical protein AAF889_00425 [Cyanobacteria bacterium P01_D01_bin.73]
MTPSTNPHPQTWLGRWGDRLGRWNPQLLRELRGNLTVKSSLATISLVIGLQFLVNYLLVSLDVRGEWGGEFLLCTRVIWLFAIIFAGGDAILRDWLNEAKLGTLGFLRLSPEPAWRILLGKLLGAPALCFLATIAWLPFHLYLVVRSGGDFGTLLMQDLFNLLIAAAFLSGILAIAVWADKLNLRWAFYLGGIFFLFPAAFSIAVSSLKVNVSTSELWWFGVNLAQSQVLLLAWCTAIAIGITAFFWSAACRRFNCPHETPLLRHQAYQPFVAFNLIGLGFFWPAGIFSGVALDGWQTITAWEAIAAGWATLQALAIWGTMPSRQQLVDWGRYQHFLRQTPKNQPKNQPKSQATSWEKLGGADGGWHQLIWNSKGPPFMVPAVNLLITLVIWSPWAIATLLTNGLSSYGLAGVAVMTSLGVVTAVFTTMTALVVSISVRTPLAKKFPIAAMPLLGIAFFPSMGLVLTSPISSLALGGLAAIGAALLTIQSARRTLARVGKSESQLLFESSDSFPQSL